MSSPQGDPAAGGRVRIPADVDREDQILAGLTARQLALLAVPAAVLWAAYFASRHLVPLPVFAALAVPIGVAVLTLALGRRDGLSADRLLLAAVGQARRPHRLVPAPGGVPALPRWAPAAQRAGEQPPAPLRLPVHGLGADGVIDLGSGGAVLICRASTVSFALRTQLEQQALVAAFARYLNSLPASIQILIRSEPVDLTAIIAGLRQAAGGLPHPGLEAAAREHADFLAGLGADRDLLTRQVLLVLSDPKNDAGAAGRLRRRAADAAAGLGAAGITITALDGAAAAVVLAGAADPWAPPRPAGLAPPQDTIFGTDPTTSTSTTTASTTTGSTGSSRAGAGKWS